MKRNINHIFLLITIIIFLCQINLSGQNKRTQSSTNTSVNSQTKQKGAAATTAPKANTNQGALSFLLQDKKNSNTNSPEKMKLDLDIWGTIKKYPALLLIPFILICISAGRVYFMYRLKPLSRAEPQTQTGRMVSKDEAAKLFPFVWGKGYMPLGYFVDSQEGKQTDLFVGLSPEERLEHIKAQAGTGSRKTTTIITPTIIQDAVSNLFNLYVVDRKGSDIYSISHKAWEDNGHSVLYFNPWDPEMTMGFEPLWMANEDEIRSIVETHITIIANRDEGKEFYLKQERLILEAVIRAAQKWGSCRGPGENVKCQYETIDEALSKDVCKPRHERCRCRRHLCTLPAVAEVIARGSDVTKRALANHPEINLMLSDIWKIREDAIAGVFTSLRSKLGIYLDPRVGAAFSRSDFNLNQVTSGTKKRKKGVILYVGADEKYLDASFTLASMMTQLMANQIYVRGEQMRKEGKSWRDIRPTILVLDEQMTYYVPTLENLLATARGSGGGILSAFQSEQQATRYYGLDAAKRWDTNFRSKIYMGGVDADVAEIVSKRMGKKLVVEKSQSWSRRGIFFRKDHGSSDTEKMKEVLVKTPDSITKMKKGTFILDGTNRPVEIEGVQPFVDPAIKYSPEELKYRKALLKTEKDSKESYDRRRRVNESCDREGRKRPDGEPKKLSYITIDWSLVEGISEIIEDNKSRSVKGGEGMLPGQESKIEAKLRDLKYGDSEHHLRTVANEYCRLHFKKPFDKITKREANKYLDELREQEREIELRKKRLKSEESKNIKKTYDIAPESREEKISQQDRKIVMPGIK